MHDPHSTIVRTAGHELEIQVEFAARFDAQSLTYVGSRWGKATAESCIQ